MWRAPLVFSSSHSIRFRDNEDAVPFAEHEVQPRRGSCSSSRRFEGGQLGTELVCATPEEAEVSPSHGPVARTAG